MDWLVHFADLYLRTGGAGRRAVDRAKVKAAERMEGKLAVYGNDDTLSAEAWRSARSSCNGWSGRGVSSRAD